MANNQMKDKPETLFPIVLVFVSGLLLGLGLALFSKPHDSVDFFLGLVMSFFGFCFAIIGFVLLRWELSHWNLTLKRVIK